MFIVFGVVFALCIANIVYSDWLISRNWIALRDRTVMTDEEKKAFVARNEAAKFRNKVLTMALLCCAAVISAAVFIFNLRL